MLSSSLNEIQHNALGQFHLAEITFLTDLHLSDFESSSFSSRMLRYLPSCEDYFEVFQSVLHQPQQIFARQWKNLLELDMCLKDSDKFGERLRQEGFVAVDCRSPSHLRSFLRE